MKKKRISNIIAIVLLVTLLGGLVAIPGSASTVSLTFIERISDPDTRNDYGPPSTTGFTDTPDQDGRIWTDKTVRDGSNPDRDDFIVTLSALSQSFPLYNGYQIPTDTVFIIDVSGSMREEDAGGERRIAVLIDALNEAIKTLQDANEYNRIAVVAYGGVSGGLARVDPLLQLDRYENTTTPDVFFSFNITPSPADYYLHVNALTADNTANSVAARDVLVYGSTPTQWGIYEGARILESVQRTDITALVPLDAPGTGDVTVTRRPNIVLMTDGEPTLGWSNYLFNTTPTNPISPTGPTGYPLLSPIATNTPPGTFYGDGSWGEMGVSLLTVLTAAHRKREVLNHYFPNGTVAGEPGQPAPSVGFYSIAFGTQPPGTAGDLIKATMSPGNPGFVPNVDNASGRNYDIRRGMTDLISYQFGPPAPVGTWPGYAPITGGNNIFKMNPNLPPGGVSPGAAPGYGGDMGNLLRAFAAPAPLPIEFHVSRRESFNTPASYMWDSAPLRITNTANLTLDEINFATLFATATDLSGLNEIFKEITTSIMGQGFQDNITDSGPERSFDGYLSFSDVLGEYMRVRSVGGLEFEGVQYSRTGFAAAITGNSAEAIIARNEYINILYHHINYGTDPNNPPNNPIYVSETTVATIVTSNIASSDFSARNSIRYYANINRDFVGHFYLPDGTPAPTIPVGAAAIVDVYPMWNTLTDPGHAPPSGDTNLRTITLHVITALRTAGFAELYATNNAGDSMMRILNEGDQMVRWYIPSSLIPVRILEADGVTVSGNQLPIRINFTVGLDRARVSAGIPPEVFAQYQVPGTTDQMYFYSNRHNPNPTNVTVAFFRPHPDNPYYKGTGAGVSESILNKSANPTGTAVHVNRNSLIAYNTSGTVYDLHWLGNNGRLTMKLIPPPPPPQPADLTIAKSFTGIPSDIDVFDTSIVSQISFLVVGYDHVGVEIYRETVFFNPTNFRWNDATRSYEWYWNTLSPGPGLRKRYLSHRPVSR
jgi:uncharacterized protein YegL